MLALWLLVCGLAGSLSCASKSSRHYVVRPGDNLYRIGLHYGVPAEKIMRANDIRDPTELNVGDKLWIPGAAKRSGQPERLAGGGAAAPEAQGRIPVQQYAKAKAEVRRRVKRESKLAFDWPVSDGRLSSRFGYRRGRRHEGIDVAAPKGTKIRAAESGRVLHAGELGSYGKAVILAHEGRYRTLYAHTRKTQVRTGQRVKQGQKIGEVGSTGNSTGPHLHFEIRKGEVARDPLLFLP